MLYFWSLIIFVKMNFFKLCHFLNGKVQNIRDFNLEGGWSALFYHLSNTRLILDIETNQTPALVSRSREAAT